MTDTTKAQPSTPAEQRDMLAVILHNLAKDVRRLNLSHFPGTPEAAERGRRATADMFAFQGDCVALLPDATFTHEADPQTRQALRVIVEAVTGLSQITIGLHLGAIIPEYQTNGTARHLVDNGLKTLAASPALNHLRDCGALAPTPHLHAVPDQAASDRKEHPTP